MLAHRDGVFVAKTVLLELEWVLRTACKLPRPDIHSAIGKLLGLANLNTESPGQVSQALDGCSRGLDFADAMHLAASAADEGMFTFDVRFVGVAAAAGLNVHLGRRAGRACQVVHCGAMIGGKRGGVIRLIAITR